MELKTFKKLLSETLISNGFSKKGSYYYQTSEEVICVVGLQKSSFSNGYYISVGYIIKQLNLKLTNPRDVDGDIRSRFLHNLEDKQSDLYDLDRIHEDDHENVVASLNSNISNLILPVSDLNSLKELLKKMPQLLYQTKLTAKQFLGYNA